MNYSIIIYILGWILKLEGAFMLLPCIVAVIYREKAGFSFLFVAEICLALGFATSTKRPKNPNMFAREGFVTVALSWIVLSAFGALPFVINGDIPNYIDAMFEMVSGFTTTGASILHEVEVLNKCSLFWRSFSHWIGGMGVIVFMLAILPMTNGSTMHLMRAESPGPSVGKLVPKIRDTALILYKIYLVMTVIEFICLVIAHMPVFDSMLITFGSAGTGGFGIKNDSMGSYSTLQQAIVTISMILFGVNFNAYYYLLGKHKKDAFKMEEVRWYFIIIAASIIVISINIRNYFDSFFMAFHQAAFQVGSIITTTGYGTTDFDLWPQLSRSILVILMFIGACAGSTGGGLKVSRLLILFKSVKQDMLKFVHPRSVKVMRFDGKAVDKELIRGVSAFFVTYILIFGISAMVISLDGNDLVTNFTAVAATFNNIGPGLAMVGPTANFDVFSYFSKMILIFDMLAGRLELYPILILFVPSIWKRSRNHKE